MAKPISHPVDACSYELQTQLRRRHQLLLGLWLTCTGFTWPGRVPHLSYQATHGTVSERVEALRLLEELPEQASRDACLAGLEDGESEVRAQAASCVGANADERAINNLLDLADAREPVERAAALDALGRIGAPRGLPSIERALSAGQPSVQVAAVRALRAYVQDGSFDVTKLEPLLRAEPTEVRLAAVELLRAAGQPARSSPPVELQRAAPQPAHSSPPVELQRAAPRPARNSPPVELQRAAPQPARSSPPVELQRAAPQPARNSPLVELQDAAPQRARISLLRAAARDASAEVRAAALRALGEARDAQLLPELIAALTDTDEAVRLAAIAALGDSDQPAAIAPLRERASLSSPTNLRAARAALAALGRIDDPSALQPLAAALPRPELTRSATLAIVARAQRLNQPDSYQQTVNALQRAIDAVATLPPPHTESTTRDTRSDERPAAERARNGNAPTAERESAQSPSSRREYVRAHFDGSPTAERARSGNAPTAERESAQGSSSGREDMRARFDGSPTAERARNGNAPTAERESAQSSSSEREDTRAHSSDALLAGRESAQSAALGALARGVLELSPFCEAREAVTSLVRVLAAGRGDEYALVQHLLALPSAQRPSGEQLLSALLDRPAGSLRLPDAVLAVLTASADAPALLTAQHEQLLRLSEARTPATPAALELHALLHVALAEGSLEARRALARVWARKPALASTQEHLARLLRWLDDADAGVREHSSSALAGAADAAMLQALSERLERGAPHPELTLRACAGAIARAHGPLRARLLKQFQRYLTDTDETVAMSALFALRAGNDQRSAPWLAGLLRGTSQPLRAAAIQSLAGFDLPETRRMLRDMLRGDNPHNASNAALALAELGTDRDVEALLRAAERGSWPLPPAAAYAAARITARGVTRKHSLERVLCRFAQLRDSYVLSNIVSALATLGADACDAQITPKNLLDPTQPSPLRTAAALWLQSTRPHSPEESAAHSALLSRCASDHDRAVAAACRPKPAYSAPAGHTLLRALEPDAQTALNNRVLALRHPDGTVFVGQSDNTGRIFLPRPAPSDLLLEDPADAGPVILPARSMNAP